MRVEIILSEAWEAGVYYLTIPDMDARSNGG